MLVTECRLTANGTVFNLVALLETGHDVQRKEAKVWDMVRWVERKGSSAVDTFSEGRAGRILLSDLHKSYKHRVLSPPGT